MKKLIVIGILLLCLLTGCGKKTDFVDEVLEEDQSSKGTLSSGIEDQGIHDSDIAREDENGIVIDDFNDDGLMQDKVRIDDFSYLADNGLDYFCFVQLQARLSRYLDYYIPTQDDKVWDATIVNKGFAEVPELYKFYVYIEELDATIECKYVKDKDAPYPFLFKCDQIEKKGAKDETSDK